jgi:hypothetical protein
LIPGERERTGNAVDGAPGDTIAEGPVVMDETPGDDEGVLVLKVGGARPSGESVKEVTSVPGTGATVEVPAGELMGPLVALPGTGVTTGDELIATPGAVVVMTPGASDTAEKPVEGTADDSEGVVETIPKAGAEVAMPAGAMVGAVVKEPEIGVTNGDELTNTPGAVVVVTPGERDAAAGERVDGTAGDSEVVDGTVPGTGATVVVPAGELVGPLVTATGTGATTGDELAITPGATVPTTRLSTNLFPPLLLDVTMTVIMLGFPPSLSVTSVKP